MRLPKLGALFCALWPALAGAESMCKAEVTALPVPPVLAERPGRVEIKDARSAMWKTTDRLLLTVDVLLRDAPQAFAGASDARGLTEVLLRGRCSGRAESCEAKVTEGGRLGVLRERFDHMGSAIYRIEMVSGDTSLVLRGIAPPAHSDWLVAAVEETLDTLVPALVPPCGGQ